MGVTIWIDDSEPMRRRARHPGPARADPAGRRHARGHAGCARRGPRPVPAGRLRRAGHRLVRRGRRRSRPRKTVAVVGDAAVGLLAVLAAGQLDADRIVIFSCHEARQKLARDFGAIDVFVIFGDQGVAQLKELLGGLGAHSVVQAVGTQQSLMQTIRSTRADGHVGYVGVFHDVAIPGEELFFSGVHLHGGPAPVRQFLPS